jgi:glycine hydroxymethyltransferase
MKAEHEKAINSAVFPGLQGGPLMHVIAAKAVSFKEALLPGFKDYQQDVIRNAQSFAAELMSLGFKLVSGGTDNHLVLLDLSKTSVSGKALEEALGLVEITVNKNTVPNETRSPFVTSGVRFGTPALTSRGLNSENMREIARLVKEVFVNLEQAPGLTPSERGLALAQVKVKVKALASKYPLYPAWEG